MNTPSNSNSLKYDYNYKHSLNINNIVKENKEAILNVNNSNDNNFTIDFKVFGKSIFQSLILTVNAYSNKDANNNTQELLPIKCSWKRVKNDTQIYIQDINSNSYMPTAEDIGYKIEVEVTPIEKIYKGTASAEFGPLLIPNDIKNSIELLLSQGEANFSCYIYDIQEQNKSVDKDIQLSINYKEVKLVERLVSNELKVLECVKLSSFNPIIKLSYFDSSRYNLKFISSEFDNNAIYDSEASLNLMSNCIKSKVKSEYDLIAMSKSQREFLYILLHSFLIDEKLKTKKLFNHLNYKVLSEELKIGIIDLISEIKTLREENNVLIHNSSFYLKENKCLKQDLKDLEEDFQMTLEQLNNPNLKIEIDECCLTKDKNSVLKSSTDEKNNDHSLNNKNNNENNIMLKKQFDELSINYASLQSKEKGLREEIKSIRHNYDLSNSKQNMLSENIKELNKKLNSKEEEMQALIKTNNYITELNGKVIKERDEVLTKIKDLEIELKLNKSLLQKDKVNEKTELNELKNKIIEINQKAEDLCYENNGLKNQNKVLKAKSDDVKKELTKLTEQYKKDVKLIEESNEINQKNNKLLIEDINKKLNIQYDKYVNLEEKYNNLYIENEELKKSKLAIVNTNNDINNKGVNGNQNISNPYNLYINNSSVLDESVYKVGRDEYEEFDNFKREKDEYECQLMYLKSNNDAMRVEIEMLKKEINK